MESVIRSFDTGLEITSARRKRFLGGTEYVHIETYTAFFGLVLLKLGGGAERARRWSGPGRCSGNGGTNCNAGSGNSASRIAWNSGEQSNATGRHHDAVGWNDYNSSVHPTRNYHDNTDDPFNDSNNSWSDWAWNHSDEPRNSGNVADKFFHHSAGWN